MARTIWRRSEDLAAFAFGKQAAIRGAARTPPAHYMSYDERAAFNDGWDSLERESKQPRREKQRKA